jgi:hypothetical protein
MRGAALVAIAAVAVALGAPLALGDADPPSDVLYLQDAYYPYHPRVATGQRNRLDDLLKRTRKAGFPIKVALIATPTDLGGIPEVFGKPQRYATFLEQELSVHRNLPLLTVMPAGYGTAATGPQAMALVARLPRPSGPDAMAAGAVTAVERLAAAAGHRVDTSNLGADAPKGTGSSSPVLLLAPIGALAVLAGGATLVARRRRRRARASQPFDWSDGP